MRNIGIPRRTPLRDPFQPPSNHPLVWGCMVPFALAIALVLALTVFARAEDERCQQLRDMARAWHGVPLSTSQRFAKRQLVLWYRLHCRRQNVEL